MTTRKLSFACPLCGSGEVFYSCTPNCCFNHVCSDCGATFEPVTRKKEANRRSVPAPQLLPEATDPTAACAACDSIAVYIAEDEAIVCGKCGTILEIEMTEINPA